MTNWLTTQMIRNVQRFIVQCEKLAGPKGEQEREVQQNPLWVLRRS
jgi:hypothetical protein